MRIGAYEYSVQNRCESFTENLWQNDFFRLGNISDNLRILSSLHYALKYIFIYLCFYLFEEEPVQK